MYLCQCVKNLRFLKLCVELLGSKAVTHTAIEHQTVVITVVIRYGKGRSMVMFNAHSAPSGARAGWFVITHALVIACADILPCKHSQRSTPTCIYSHICEHTKTFSGALARAAQVVPRMRSALHIKRTPLTSQIAHKWWCTEIFCHYKGRTKELTWKRSQ